MTPNDLLEGVKARFYSFKIKEPELLKALLTQALGAYQDKAGVTVVTQITDTAELVGVPDDFLARVVCKDSRGSYVVTDFDQAQKKLRVDKSGLSAPQYPLNLTYFVNLREVKFDQYQLSDTITGLLSDYLEVLIQVPNFQRMKNVMSLGGFDTADIPTEETLQGRKKELEADMKAARCALPMISIR